MRHFSIEACSSIDAKGAGFDPNLDASAPKHGYAEGNAIQTEMKPSQKRIALNNKLLTQATHLLEKGHLKESEVAYKKLLSLYANHPAALYSLAVIESHRSNLEAAIGYLDKAVLAAPKSVDVWIGRGQVLRDVGRIIESLDCFDRALTLDPSSIVALNESAALLHGLNRRTEAISRLERSVSIKPTSPALFNLSALQGESIQDEDLLKAIHSLESLVAIDPDFRFVLGRLLYQKVHICDWENYQALTSQVIEGLRAGKSICTPIPCMVMSSEALEHQRCAQSFAPFFFKRTHTALWNGEHYQHKKIRVAYVSPDLRDHPVGQLMVGVIERHDKSKFELVAISTGPNIQDAIRARMESSFDKFIDVNGLAMVEVAKLIRSLEVDIAIDLGGYTAGTGSVAFSYRPAPIQVNFLGFPGTLGADFIDYIIADEHVIPEKHEVFYNEKVIRLPDTYLPTNGELQVTSATPTRMECGLPAEGIVFCSFSHDHKINPPVFDIWMKLLQQTAGSVLWLMSRVKVSENNLRNEAEKRGIAPDRLVFAKRLPLLADHLARYRLADIFLDTFPYNAHTTAADALLVGLPVLTCMGNAFPSRVAGSLLHAIGMQELVTYSLPDYFALALRLAADPAALSSVKSKLSNNIKTYPLFDTGRYCINLESALQTMYRQKFGERATEGKEGGRTLLDQALEFQGRREFAEAERLVRTHLELHPDDAAGLYVLATILIDRKDLALALESINVAVVKAPHYPPLWFACGAVAAQLGKHDVALASYDKAIALNPVYVEALNNSCVLLHELQRTEEALARYQLLLKAKEAA